MSIKQVSVFLENRAGQLSEVTSILANNGVDLRALHISETTDYGMLRIIASDTEKAEAVLRAENIPVSTSDVILVSVSDAPGGLAALLKVLADENIDFSYMYSAFGKTEGAADMVIKVSDIEAVEKLLDANGFKANKD